MTSEAAGKIVSTYVADVCNAAGVRVHVFADGSHGLVDVPAKWAAIIDALAAGMQCALAGCEEVPELPKVVRRRAR